MKRIASAGCILLLAVACLLAQSLTQLNGTITDPTGASIPDATIRLENVDTQASREVQSDAAGNYVIPQVAPGNYRVSAKAAGFSDVVVNNVRLLVNTPATINIAFEKVGSVASTVEVSADAIQINTTDATIGNSFGTKPILQLPFEGRNVVGLLSLQPGVTFLGEPAPYATPDYRSGAVNGGKADQANVTLDGVDANNQQGRSAFTGVPRVTLDSIQEFRVVTTNANADQGRSSGAQIALVTKSGTNEIHGSLYHFLRNKATNANSFFNNSNVSAQNPNGIPLAKLNRNIFGGSLGGPIVRNKLFFFFNYEGRKDRREDSVQRVVPTATLRQGIVRYTRTDGSIGTLSPTDIRDRIDPLRIGVNQAALAVLNRYPLPNDPSAGDGLNTLGFRFNAPITLDWNTYTARFDYNLSTNHQLFLRGILQDDKATDVPQLPGLAPNDSTLENSRGLATGINSVLRPNLVSVFRYGFTRQGIENTGSSDRVFVSFRTLSLPEGSLRAFRRTTPVHNFTHDMTWTKGSHTVQFGTNIRLIRNTRVNFGNSFPSASGNASWLTGSGSQLNAPVTDVASVFRVSLRDALVAALGVVSQGNANYLYDAQGNTLPVGSPIRRQFNAEEYEFYGQDTWRVNRALTVTAGLRYSLMPPIYEADGLQTIANPSLSEFFDRRVGAANAGQSQVTAGRISYTLRDLPGGRDLYPFHKRNFAPRFAVAYSPQGTDGLSKFLFGGPGQTSIRAGWGMYYDLFGSGLITSYDASALGLTTAITNSSAVLNLSTAPRFTGLNTIPNGLLVPAPRGGFPQEAPDVFAITNSLDDRLKPPYTMNMNFSIGRELGGGWFVQGSYVGRLSRRSLISEDVSMPTNLRDPASGVDYFTAARQLATLALNDTPTANVPRIPYFENLFPGLAAGGRSATQGAYEVFAGNAPDWTYALYQLDVLCDPACSRLGEYAFYNEQYSYLRTLRSIGNGNYHGLQLTTRKRFNNGDQIDFNYTWSKSIDLASRPENQGAETNGVIINAFNRRQFRSVSDYDVTHLWNANFIYNLPFGRGRRFLDGGGFLDAVVGGWQLGGLYRQSSGLPTSVGNGRFWPTNWNITGYATQVSPVESGAFRNAPAPAAGTTSGPNLFANPGQAIRAFQNTLPGEAGDRNNLRGDGYFGIDANLAKSFRMPYNENHTLQFRWEVFNITNSVRFDPFNVSADLGNSGSFGKYTSLLTQPRVMQFGLRYDF